MINLHRRSRQQAMTLIELLSVIAVVGVLACIILAASGKVRLIAQKASATSNYRQIGTAIQMYVAEHDGALPGSLRVGQFDHYSTSSSGREMLGYHLWHYLGLPEPEATSRAVAVFSNPLTLSTRRADNSPMFVVNNRAMLDDGVTVVNPWGYTDDANNPGRSIRLADLGQTPANWALQDVDALHRTTQGAGWQSATPQKPPLGSSRLTLFFDWHVGEDPIDS